VHLGATLRPHTKQATLKITTPAKWSAKPALAIKSGSGKPNIGSTSPYGLTPAQMRGAYGLGQFNSSSVTFAGAQADGSGQTIAIVDAYDDPNALSDLNAFSAQFGLPKFNTADRGILW